MLFILSWTILVFSRVCMIWIHGSGNIAYRFFTSEGPSDYLLMDLQLVVEVNRAVNLSHSHEQVMISVSRPQRAIVAAQTHQTHQTH
jgi:hypothetical protein